MASGVFAAFRNPASAGAAALALVLSLALAAASVSPARAYPDAQVESLTRPGDLGWLLGPPIGPGLGPGGPGPWGPSCGFGPRCGCGPRFGRGCFGARFGFLNRVVVNCDGWRGGDIQRALAALRPGGTLILRTHGGSCNEPIYIFRSVQIVGEGGPFFGPPPYPIPRAVLTAPPGLPCISVAPGVRAVSIRGLVINAPNAQGAACIQAHDADVELRDTIIRYCGIGSAIYVAGGTLQLKNLGVAARTPSPAVVSQGADVNFEDVRVAAIQLGLLVEPGPGPSRLLRVFARSLLDGGPGDEAHPTTGLLVRAGAPSGRIEITDTVLLGFATGVRFDHDVTAELRYGRIGFSRVGVITDGDVGIRGMTIGAAEVGVYVRSGRARIILNRIFGVRFAAIFADPGAQVWAAGNRVYPGPDCGFMRDNAYNSTGQECRPWAELPDDLRTDRPYDGRFEDGWSEWRNFDWGYDANADAWRSGPGYYDEGAWGARQPDFRGDFGYRGGPAPGGPDGPGGPGGPGGPDGPGGLEGPGEAFSGGTWGLLPGGPPPPNFLVRPFPTYTPPYWGTYQAPQSPTKSTDLDLRH